jgi:CBS domain-containing protein
MNVSEVMVKNPVEVKPDTSCREIARLMKNRKIGSVVLVEKGKPVGIITERDLVHRVMALEKDQNTCTAEEVATKPVIAVSIHADVEMVVDIMKDYNIRRLVVVDKDDKMVGIVTTDDLSKQLRGMSEELAVKYSMFSRKNN